MVIMVMIGFDERKQGSGLGGGEDTASITDSVSRASPSPANFDTKTMVNAAISFVAFITRRVVECDGDGDGDDEVMVMMR